jgi:hypothetical protein
MMVAVGTGVSVGRGVEVAGMASTVRQELTRSASALRSGVTTEPPLRLQAGPVEANFLNKG